MSFSVTILGSSSAKPTLSRHPSAQVVNVHEQYYLVDAGEGVQQQLIRYGINPLRLRAVFISHLHGDHVFGLFPLISTLALYGRIIHPGRAESQQQTCRTENLFVRTGNPSVDSLQRFVCQR